MTSLLSTCDTSCDGFEDIWHYHKIQEIKQFVKVCTIRVIGYIIQVDFTKITHQHERSNFDVIRAHLLLIRSL